MEAILEICCGLDVHRDNIVACIMKGPLDEKPISETRTFSALRHGLEDLRTWLGDEGCHNVAMESTGVYWKSVYAILEDASQGDMEILLGPKTRGQVYCLITLTNIYILTTFN